ncbi:hypothetical protein VB780_08080 [Leptolyngbya sp. CCNP1308]|uniref:hypothetical protein n=1 Tax=Leptolyngbya sp. CCNP1308 TaxID=3110255 RepID=UPI002B205F30|nr:hypothetical protein [Leptolyngbya sp. CCNP1308]MEA5448519.1 hypothetical protein [Leptolyngbya sp. CCNP1308]
MNEIKDQCEYALSAIRHSDYALQQIIQQVSTRDIDYNQLRLFQSEVSRNIHSFLTHASNVSRMFWPPFPRKEKTETDKDYKDKLLITDRVVRAKALKEEYSLKENNVLKDRKLRNHLEHYDERLDDWSKNSKNRNIATINIGPLGSISPSSDPLDNMRQFDPDRNIYRFRGEDYDLQNIKTAISEILTLSQNLEEKLREHGSQST